MISNKGSRLVSVNAVHTKLVSETSKAHIGAYNSTCCILIGADTSTCYILIGAAIGRFNGMTKTRCFNVFMSLRKRLTGSTVKATKKQSPQL